MGDNLGMGALLYQLGGGSENDSKDFVGKKITNAKLDDNELHIEFDDGIKIKIFDDAQSCCEQRWMETDDDLNSLVGGTLKSITLKNGPDESTEYEEKDSQFMEIQTDKGFITVKNYNRHNGYYGGFGMNIRKVTS